MAVVPQVGECQSVSIVHEPPSLPFLIIAGVLFGVIPQQHLVSDVSILAVGGGGGVRDFHDTP